MMPAIIRGKKGDMKQYFGKFLFFRTYAKTLCNSYSLAYLAVRFIDQECVSPIFEKTFWFTDSGYGTFTEGWEASIQD